LLRGTRTAVCTLEKDKRPPALVVVCADPYVEGRSRPYFGGSSTADSLPDHHTHALTSVAHVHTTDLPQHAGERRLAQKLAAFEDEKLNLWFSLGYLPGVRDIDLLVAHQDLGVFLVEVKAVPLSAVQSYGFQRCEIEGRPPDQGPTVQAHDAFLSLRSYLSQFSNSVPFITPTACWPLIGRAEWNAKWDKAEVIGRFSQGMLFREDIESGEEVFRTRLKAILENPPVRGGASSRGGIHARPGVGEKQIEGLKRALSPVARAKTTPSEVDRLRQLERGITAQVKKDFPVADRRRAVFAGYPGTGKTFRLLQIGLFHALEGKNVLFSCFNKTLAADIRRLVGQSDMLRAATGRLDVSDVFELATHCFHANGLPFVGGGNEDAWGEMVTEELRKRLASQTADVSLMPYRTILIDEAQDMSRWQLELLSLHMGERATVAVARGQGQELYSRSEETAGWFAEFERAGARQVALRRNFRNPRPIYYVAHAFFEAFPNRVERLRAVFERICVQEDQQIAFDRKEGGTTRVINLQEPADQDSVTQAQHMSDQYYEVIREEYEALKSDPNATPIDLLILVPDTRGSNCEWARDALTRLCGENAGLAFIDYTREAARRASARNNQVRLCTFHSSRGLEGSRVVIFGFELIGDLAERVNVDVRNLAFVVLSRAVFETVIAIRSVVSRDTTQFLKSILQTYHERTNAQTKAP
jgi:hypothetical protein